tara:strand:+ start:1155 stop:1586 length:432 start_codon:yes stop_codon:yes gene_type:complete
MNQPKTKFNYMNNKLFKKQFLKSKKNFFRLKLLNNDIYNTGIIYTLYSDELNLLEVGYAKNNHYLKNLLSDNRFILLDMKEGSLKDLSLLRKTLNQLGVYLLNYKYYQYSNKTIRYINLLGWPIGTSLYKQRKIRKEISYAAS